MIEAFGAKKHATSSGGDCLVACQKELNVLIPGTTRLQPLEENIGSTGVELTAHDLLELEHATDRITVEGDRYAEELERMTCR